MGLWPQAKLSSDRWEGAVDRSDGGGAIYSPEICHATLILCATLGVSPAVTGKDSSQAAHPPDPCPHKEDVSWQCP